MPRRTSTAHVKGFAAAIARNHPGISSSGKNTGDRSRAPRKTTFRKVLNVSTRRIWIAAAKSAKNQNGTASTEPATSAAARTQEIETSRKSRSEEHTSELQSL